jgi:ATP-binding cassette subfamily F protein 3
MAQEEEIIEKTRQNIQRREKEIHRFISRFRAKARLANLVQSRIKSLEKMDKGKKLEKIKTLDFCFRSKPFKGKYVLSAKKLSFSYTPEKRFIDNFDMTVSSGQRICLIGKNGKGKTTLLKLLAQQLEPESGEVLYNPQTTAGFFEQTNIKSLVDTRTVLEEILFAHTDVDQQIARDICGAMLFEGEASLKKIQILSGGEKSRVMLGKLLVTPVNLLLLDEPTNHLDMESCDALLAAIDAFEGTVIMVTHNEMFLHALADRLVIFRDEGIDMFEGSYGRFLNERGWNDDEKTCLKDGMQTEQKNSDKLTKKEIRRRRSEIITQRSKLLNPMENRIAEIENAIDAKEKEVEAFNHAMMDASLDNNGKKIGELSKNINQCETAIEKYFQELELLSETYEEKKEKFDKQLENLEQPDSYSAGS